LTTGEVGAGDAIFAIFGHKTNGLRVYIHHFLLTTSIDYVQHFGNLKDGLKRREVTASFEGKLGRPGPGCKGGWTEFAITL
jgi:hypothetical protein